MATATTTGRKPFVVSRVHPAHRPQQCRTISSFTTNPTSTHTLAFSFFFLPIPTQIPKELKLPPLDNPPLRPAFTSSISNTSLLLPLPTVRPLRVTPAAHTPRLRKSSCREDIHRGKHHQCEAHTRLLGQDRRRAHTPPRRRERVPQRVRERFWPRYEGCVEGVWPVCRMYVFLLSAFSGINECIRTQATNPSYLAQYRSAPYHI